MTEADRCLELESMNGELLVHRVLLLERADARAYKFSERHGGEIGFLPTPWGGATFFFELPAAPADDIGERSA